MNCQNFTERMREVARGGLMDAAARSEALAHGEACGSCAARLADERALTEALRALAERDAGLSAPPRVEAALLAAFRERHAAPAVSAGGERLAATHAPAAGRASNLADARDVTRWTWARTLATAATAAAAAAAFLMIVAPWDAPRQHQQPARPEVASARPESMTTVGSTTNETPSIPEPLAATTTTSTTGVNEPARAMASGGDRTTPAARRATQGRAATIQANYTGGGPGAGRDAAVADTADAEGEEFATDFITLPQAAPDATVVAGQLVRVELPRSALSRFGLPVSSERASERVKADVLLGEDGVARAIRFVR